jgi:hypothetical protein
MSVNIVFILDTSWSVSDYKDYYVNGVNFVLDNQKIINPSTLVSFVQFNDNYFFNYVREPIQNIPKMTSRDIKIQGMTSLYDTVYNVINIISKTSDPTLFIIITDGLDNSSRIVTKNMLKETIQKTTNSTTKFVYIGGDQNASDIGNNLGIQDCVTFSSSEKSIQLAMEMTNKLVSKFMYEITGVYNNFANSDIIDDVSDTFLNNFHI